MHAYGPVGGLPGHDLRADPRIPFRVHHDDGPADRADPHEHPDDRVGHPVASAAGRTRGHGESPCGPLLFSGRIISRGTAAATPGPISRRTDHTLLTVR